MRAAITIDPRDPHRDRVRDGTEFLLLSGARSGWRVREGEAGCGSELPTLGFDGPSATTSFHRWTAPLEHRAAPL